MRKAFGLIAGLAGAAMLYSCAQMGTPSGGPRDEDPPVFVRANPMPGATNVSRTRLTLEFDELVNVKDAFSKVVVSPTSETTPRVTSSGRRVNVDLGDSLKSNTTYTIDFGNAIEDYNEGNKLQGFSYTFSTGDELDSLQISGMVLAARNLEPQQGMLVGVHRAPTDTTFQRVRLERVAKTDDRGRFNIRGLQPGEYHVYAIGDLNNDYRWDNPEENIAFLGRAVTPSSRQTTTTDTIFNLKTGAVDTIMERARTQFLPNDILLNSFNVDYKAQYLAKNERIDSTRIALQLNARSDTLPVLRLVDRPEERDWYTLDRSATNDTLTYWLRKPNLIAADTLFVAVSYPRTNAQKTVENSTDTIRFVTVRPKPAKVDKKHRHEQDSIAERKRRFMEITSNATGTIDVFQPLILEVPEPVARFDTAAFRLEEKEDTVWKPARGDLKIALLDSALTTRRYIVDRRWDYGKSYRVSADSAAVTGIYGRVTDRFSREFSAKKEEDYSALTFNIRGLANMADSTAFVELLNSQDNPVRTARVVNSAAVFRDLTPATYYARLVEDPNRNGMYDTGSYADSIQPELVYYYPKKLTVKANWELSQEWDVNELPIDRQKPSAIKKNKSDEEKKRRSSAQSQKEEEEEEDLPFDATQNPFDPNSRNKYSRQNTNQYGR